jgi:hypothetical protein
MTVLATSTSICAGESVTLLALGAGSISWDNGIQNNVAFTPEMTNTYTVTGDDGNGCAASESIEIVVNSTPQVPTITNFAGNLVSSAVNGNQWFLDGVLIDNATSQLYTPIATGNYTVTVSQGNCSSTSEALFYEIIVTSLHDFFTQVTLSPNPAHDVFTLSGLTSNTQIHLSSITGQTILNTTSTGTSLQIDVSELFAGIYFVTISQDINSKTMKLVIQ